MASDDVRGRLARHVLTDGLQLILDLRRSRGSWLVDARTGERYLDLYTFFASAPLGISPAGVVDDPEFLAQLTEAAVNKPTNPDIYTSHYADFVDAFARVLGDPALPHMFFVEGGALAVENALKCAFDWKSRHNEMHGRPPQAGTKVLHLTRAFHGRSGYTLSLTNTDPVKTERYPKFDWPRIEVPAVTFPLAGHLDEVVAAEQRALGHAEAAFRDHRHDIACFIAEPIQGEGGDNHMRPEFLQAMQRLCQENDALFILDEVQTGVGLTGTAWAYQQLGLAPTSWHSARKYSSAASWPVDASTRSRTTCSRSAGGSTPPGAAGWWTWSAVAGCLRSSSVTGCSTVLRPAARGSSPNCRSLAAVTPAWYLMSAGAG